MSKITDEANRIVKMTNDSQYMGYSFVSEAQQQAVNVLKMNKDIKELSETLHMATLLIKQYSEAGEVMPYLFQEKAAHELAVKHLDG